jgi:hypothetical protein
VTLFHDFERLFSAQRLKFCLGGLNEPFSMRVTKQLMPETWWRWQTVSMELRILMKRSDGKRLLKSDCGL